ncbi:inosine-uridine preferring nucleoside hydrolase [Nocardioides albertanoniae]|uniref:Inosine-uridine preferring nucleoside hydrolase n=1 Tax=Nocardioides albertanoniae TaxID=1175486 RepID=A0A543A708_9ACTN|nr:inosine-uridine preferring nucleoside hydrolase [Nocardioides albertanoniae]
MAPPANASGGDAAHASAHGAGPGAADAHRRPAPAVIFDGDVGPDPCDFSTLAMLHHLHETNEINLLGIMGTMPERSNVEVVDVFNRWYGHRIPIGTFKDRTDRGYDRFVRPASQVAHTMFPASRTIAAHYASWHPKTFAEVPDSVRLYRRLLAAQEDHSVTIMTAGQLYNIKALLNSGPDAASPLSGADLVRKKVGRFVMMIGAFGKPMTAADLAYYRAEYGNHPPNAFFPLTVSQHASSSNGVGAEYNAHAWYPGLTQGVFERLDRLGVPKTFVGNEQGWRVPAGTAYNRLSAHHPVRMGYYVNNAGSNLVDPHVAKTDPAYDEIALLYLARGRGDFFDTTKGRARFESSGTSTWTDEPGSRDERLTLVPGVNDDHSLTRLVERLVMGPESTWTAPVG